VLVYGRKLGDDIVELLPQHTVSQYLDQGTIDVVEYDKGQVTNNGIRKELAFQFIMRSKETQEEHSVGYLVTQDALLLMNIDASLLDSLHIHRVLELRVTPVELDKENSPPQSLVVVLAEPLHISVSRNKEGHVLGTVGAWYSLSVTVSRVFLVKALLPLIVDLLLGEGLIVKLVHQHHRLGFDGL
jgi:hypothetical protein